MRPCIKEALRRLDSKILNKPRSYTSQLQVLDFGANHPFKLYMRKQYESFMKGGTRKVPRLFS